MYSEMLLVVFVANQEKKQAAREVCLGSLKIEDENSRIFKKTWIAHALVQQLDWVTFRENKAFHEWLRATIT